MVSNAVLVGIDPSRTTSLRNAFARQMLKRFRTLQALIVKAIVDEDVLGLLPESATAVTILAQTPGRRRFNFPRPADKIAAFMEWLDRAIRDEILQVSQIEQVGRSVGGAWTNLYVQAAYKRGVTKARQQLSQIAPSLATTGGIDAVLASSVHVDTLGLLYTRTFNELKGITDTMSQRIARILAQGLANGSSAKAIARSISASMSQMGASLATTDILGRAIPASARAEMLARTEIIRAHAEAQLQEFKNWGIAGVSVKAELITAGDHRVCQVCQRLSRTVYTIEEARDIIPLHPRCRCIWLPFIDKQTKKK